MLAGVYLIENMPLGAIGGSFIFTYVVQPLLWLLVVLAVWYFPRARATGRLRLKGFLNLLAFICAAFYILMMLAGGMLDGFGRSPYSFTPLGILTNLVFVGSALLGVELARAFLINNLAERRPFLVISLFSIFFAVLNLSLRRVLTLNSIYEFTKYAGNFLLPALSESFMTSYLAYLGGPIPALIYHGTLQGFQWFCPILPNLGWITKTFLGGFIPFISMIVVQQVYLLQTKEIRNNSRNKESVFGWIITSISSVLIIWFAVGLFPVYPSVIATGSMEPMIKPGDVTIMKKIKDTDIKTGDVIQFRHEDIFITHRVIDIKDEQGKRYQTKGDNNPSPDSELVVPQQVKGKLMYIIPKIGWPSLILRSSEGG